VLKLAEIESPEPRKPHDVLIRLRTGGVNPADCQARTRPFCRLCEKAGQQWIGPRPGRCGIVEAAGFYPWRLASPAARCKRDGVTNGSHTAIQMRENSIQTVPRRLKHL
jgi:NADPH:quinone reductase-like Zn-dependent oxidoreductase